ncbi:MAG: efflux RND transporter periplasmic adaptor subunit [Phycisphaerales bacterium]|nr:MAG: efflux RND transporter periplasmic adaptor subunit [Phycisphaerales bacterium]
MKKSRVVIIAVIVIIVLAAIGAMFMRRKLARGPKPTIVRIEHPKRDELVEFVSAPGEIEPKKHVAISAKVSARIIELPFEEGDRVTAGDPNADPPVPPSVLVRLDAKDLESQLRSATASREAQAAQIKVDNASITAQQATLTGLQASLKQAQRDLERQRELLQSQDISQAAFDQAKLKLDEFNSQYQAAIHRLEAAKLSLVVLQHNLDAADARIAQANEALGYTTITAPIDGTVTRINAEVGELVMTGTMNNPGTVIIAVGDLSEMLVVAEVDESDVGKLKVGQAARAHIQAWPDKVFPGTVQAIALSNLRGLQGSKYYEAEVLLVDPNEQIFTGMTADVDIEVAEHKDVLILPSQAVLGRKVDELPIDIRDKLSEEEKKKTFATVVFRYNDGKAIITPVKIGPSNPTHTVIERGLTEDDGIVVGPYKELEKLRHEQLIKDEREAKAEQEAKEKKADANDGNDVTDVNKTR